MATLNQKDMMTFVKETVEQRDNYDYGNYLKYVDTAPYPVTYFKQDEDLSTLDKGMFNVENRNGINTSKKYTKINNVPLWKMNPETFDLDSEEGVIKGSFNSTAILPASIFRPLPDDYFVISFKGKDYIFRVTDFLADNFREHYIQIPFKLSSSTDINKFDVVEEYDCIYENIGTEKKHLIKHHDKINLDGIEEIFNNIRSEYLDAFYIKRACAFIFDSQKEHCKIYDPYLTKFISDNEIFATDRANSLFVNEMLPDKPGFKQKYNTSLFRDIEKNRIKKRYDYKCRLLIIDDYNSYMGRASGFKSIEMFKKELDVVEELYKTDYISLVTEDIEIPTNVTFDYLPDTRDSEEVNEFPVKEQLETGYVIYDDIESAFPPNVTTDKKRPDIIIDDPYSKESYIDLELHYKGPVKKSQMYMDVYTLDDEIIKYYKEIICLYKNKNYSQIPDILKELDDCFYINDNKFSHFILTPIILYIIKQLSNNIIKE